MFKKPLSNLKTSAPLRSSDRRKLKQRIESTFGLSSEDGDILVPDGILSLKFSTHLNEPGVAYLSPEGDPIWFTVGRGSDELIPTIYTLWKKQEILPFLSTPAAVIPVLVGGADLMIPGVVHHTPSLVEGQLVAIRQYTRENESDVLSPSLAVGRMALPSDQLRDGGKEKGKAVYVVHTWKDRLWEMGSKPDVPEGSTLDQRDDGNENAIEGAKPATPPPKSQALSYTPQETTNLLLKSLLQAISTTVSSLPPSSFPIPSTLLYTNHILPSRPAFPTLVLPPSALSPTTAEEEEENKPHIDPSELSIKSSNHKSLTSFLKSAEKQGLLTLKSPPKHSNSPDILITSINGSHPLVADHQAYVTVGDLEKTAAKRAKKEEREKEEEKRGRGEVGVRELWKPHLGSLDLFEGLGGSKTALYTLPEIKTLLNTYIASKNLVNQNDQAYINLDDLLYSCVSSKTKGSSKPSKAGGGGGEEEAAPMMKFMKRDELTGRVTEKMQSWYEVRVEGREVVRKKGPLKPIQVTIKVRQGRKASTLIVGFEPFLVVEAEEMAEELRRVCAGSTSVSPIAGKPAGSGVEVLVQGKQAKAVTEYLVGKGIPKNWIQVSGK